jgi:hypothetical protein
VNCLVDLTFMAHNDGLGHGQLIFYLKITYKIAWSFFGPVENEVKACLLSTKHLLHTTPFLQILIIDTIDFFCNFRLFILFKIFLKIKYNLIYYIMYFKYISVFYVFRIF